MAYINDLLPDGTGSFGKYGNFLILNLEKHIDRVRNAPEEGITDMAHGRTRVLVGISEDGKPIYKQISGRTQDERNDAIVTAYVQSGRIWEFMSDDVMKPSRGGKKKITVAEFAGEWYEKYKRDKLAKTTEYQLYHRVRKIQKWFGDMPMADVSTPVIQDFFNSFSNLGHETLKTLRATLKELFTYAEEDGVIPARAIAWNRVKSEGVKRKTRRAASLEEYRDIVAHLLDLTDPVEQLAVAILIYTGMRPEELLGLRWEDIDLDAKKLHVERAQTFASSKAAREVKEPKTRGSKTWISINSSLAEILERHKLDEGWVIHDGNGQPFATYALWNRKWKAIKSHINLHGLRPCEFRKTVPTIMNATGVDPKAIQRLLRHSTLDTTMNVYAEVEPTAFIEGCEALATVAG